MIFILQPCSFGECVPYYQCANGTIITDGEGLLDIRFGQEENIDSEKHPCRGLFETCCSLKTNMPIVPPTPIHTSCGIRNQDGVGFRITGDKDNEAQFGLLPKINFVFIITSIKTDSNNIEMIEGFIFSHFFNFRSNTLDNFLL